MNNKEYAKIVSKNLKRLLYDNGKSQTALSRDLNIPKTTISGWLNGNRTPRMKYIDMLCDYFSVTRTDIMDDQRGYSEKSIHPETTGDFSAMFLALNPEGQKLALDYIGFLLTKEEYKKSKAV